MAAAVVVVVMMMMMIEASQVVSSSFVSFLSQSQIGFTLKNKKTREL
jgi:hypothetical protein